MSEQAADTTSSASPSSLTGGTDRILAAAHRLKNTLWITSYRPDAAAIKALDVNVKKCTTFVKKLSRIGDDNKVAIMKEAASLNLNRYLSEVANALVNTKPPKNTEVDAIISVCTIMHQKYLPFSKELSDAFYAYTTSQITSVTGEREKELIRRRSMVRLLCGLVISGVMTADKLVESIELLVQADVATLKVAVTSGNDQALLDALVDLGSFSLPTIESLLKSWPHDLCGSDDGAKMVVSLQALHGLKCPTCSSICGCNEASRSLITVPPMENTLCTQRMPAVQLDAPAAAVMEVDGAISLLSVATSPCKTDLAGCRCVSCCSARCPCTSPTPVAIDISAYDAQPSVLMEVPRALSADVRKRMKLLIDKYTQIWCNIYKKLLKFRIKNIKKRDELLASKGILTDAEEKYFDSVVDASTRLRPSIALLLGASDLTKSVADIKLSDDILELEAQLGPGSSPNAISLPSLPTQSINMSGISQWEGDDEREFYTALTNGPGSVPVSALDLEDAPLPIESLLERLRGVGGRRLVDEFAAQYMKVDNKASRKKLVKAMSDGVQRSSYHLLPFQARLVATLDLWGVGDIKQGLVEFLESQLRHYMARKGQFDMQARLLNARLLGELAKFGLWDTNSIFQCLRHLCESGTSSDVEVAAALVECCGRYLYRHPETHARMEAFLVILQRVREVKRFDARIDAGIENAMFACAPPAELPKRMPKQRTPLQLYIRYLLFDCLDNSRTQQNLVLRAFKALPMKSDPECYAYVIKMFCKYHHFNYSNVNSMAWLVANLAYLHPRLSCFRLPQDVIDTVCEDIRSSLEMSPDDYALFNPQSRVIQVHYLGQLFNYGLCDSLLIFDTLYTILLFGSDSALASSLDPPDDFLRVRLICTLLDTIGDNLIKPYVKKRLDAFAAHLARYLYVKSKLVPLPPETVWMIDENIKPLVSASHWPKDLEAAEAAVSKARRATGVPTDIQDFDIEERDEDERDDMAERQRRKMTDGDGDDVTAAAGGDGGDDFGDGDDDDDYDEDEDDEEVDTSAPVADVAPSDPTLDAEIEALIRDELEARRRTNQQSSKNVVIHPKVLKAASNVHASDEISVPSSSTSNTAGSSQVVVLAKSGTGKQTSRVMSVPTDAPVMTKPKVKNSADEDEVIVDERLKRMILEYEERDSSQPTGPVVAREPRVRQPKGPLHSGGEAPKLSFTMSDSIMDGIRPFQSTDRRRKT